MTSSGAQLLKGIALVLFGLIILGYSAFQAKNLLFGPVISITSPQNGTTFNSPLIEITGKVKNAAKISLDGRQIFTDESGTFSEKLLLSPGYNILRLEAQDKFGSHAEKTLELTLKEY